MLILFRVSVKNELSIKTYVEKTLKVDMDTGKTEQGNDHP